MTSARDSTSPSTRWIGWRGVRWKVCALLFFAITINYVDRQVIGVLKPVLEKEFGWSQVDYSNIVFAFQVAYAVGMLGMGWLIDRVGVKWGLGLAVAMWSVAAIGHGFAHFVPLAWATTFFASMRVLLGLFEAGAFPGAIRATADWFPTKERSLSTGLFNSGSNVGAIVTPLAVPLIVWYWDWPEAFWITGGVGLIWLVFWWRMYATPERHPALSPAKLAYIRADPPDPVTKVPWATLLRHRQTWAFALGKFMTDPIWWMYLFWVPDFLAKRHGLDLKSFGPPLVVIYLAADVGSVGGGWLGGRLLKRGWTANKARKLTMLVCALCVTPIVLASTVSSVWTATALIALAAAAHQGWSANLFTIASDTMPRRAVGSVVGIGGMAGAVGGMLIAKVVGYVLEWTNNSYFIPFLIAGTAYLAALAVIHLLSPTLERADLDPPAPASAQGS